ncbi:MAG: hypothetical protein K2W85_00015 [Phycisphaerales bacterium]|nr:hypothetical protein [Phycisphaerales bacterium]
MQIRNRLCRIERSLGLNGPGGTACFECRSAERRVIALFKDDIPGFAARPATAPVLCPGCGRDMNSYVEVVFVDMIAGRRSGDITHERYESSSGT